MKQGYVYIITNNNKDVFYIGVTSDLTGRVWEHKQGSGSQFTAKYKCHILIYYEWYEDINHAINREKQLKNWKRSWKIELIKKENPMMNDLYYKL